jgi:hypothetical protein
MASTRHNAASAPARPTSSIMRPSSTPTASMFWAQNSAPLRGVKPPTMRRRAATSATDASCASDASVSQARPSSKQVDQPARPISASAKARLSSSRVHDANRQVHSRKSTATSALLLHLGKMSIPFTKTSLTLDSRSSYLFLDVLASRRLTAIWTSCQAEASEGKTRHLMSDLSSRSVKIV